MAINVSNGDIIRITFTLENTGTVTTNYYIYFIFDSPGQPTITYPALRQQLTPGEIKTIPPTLALANFVEGNTYSLTISAQYPDGSEVGNSSQADVIYVQGVPTEIFVDATDDNFTNNFFPDDADGNGIEVQVVADSVGGVYYDGFLKFNVPDVNITFAYLRLYVPASATPTAGRILLMSTVDTNWTEDTVTHNNKPGLTENLSLYVDLTANTDYWTNIDITAFVQANRGRAIGISMIGADDPVWQFFSSKEGGNAPNLRIIYT